MLTCYPVYLFCRSETPHDNQTVLLCNIYHSPYLKQIILISIQILEFLQYPGYTPFSDMIILMYVINTVYIVTMLEKINLYLYESAFS